MPMRMENPCRLVRVNLIYLPIYFLNKLFILNGRISLQLSECLSHVRLVIHVKTKYWLSPFLEFGHFLSWELIPVSRDANLSIIPQRELSIFESPTVIFEPLFFISDGLATFDDLRFDIYS